MASDLHAQAEKLLAEARRGNSSALGTLFGRYHNYIKLLASAHVCPRIKVRASASDIAQETFLHAHRGFSDFRGTTGGEFIAWLQSILTRRIQHLYRQNLFAQKRDIRREISLEAIRKRMDRSTIQLGSVLIDKAPTPASEAQCQERGVHVADALAELHRDYRQVLMMRSVEGLTFAEVAARMNRSEGAVRMLWLRGIRKLKDHLQRKDQL